MPVPSLFDKSQSSLGRLYFLFLLLVLFSLPWAPIRVNNMIIVFAGIFGILFAYRADRFRSLTFKKPLLLLVLFFLLQVAGLVYSTDPLTGLRNIETKLPLIVLPLLAIVTQFALDDRRLRILFWSFIAGVLLTCLIGWGHVLASLFQFDTRAAFENSHLKFVSFVHPAYLGLYASFSIVLLVLDIWRFHSHRKLKVLVIGVLLISLIFINARTAILGLVVVLLPYFLLRFRKYSMVLLAGFIIFLAALLLHPATQERFIHAPLKAIRLEGKIDGHDESNWAFSFRYQVYDCALACIRNRPLTGYGTGGDEAALMECYHENNYAMVADRNLNAHNEYLEGMLRHGIVGLLLFLLMLLLPFTRSITQNIPEFYLFLLLFAISALSESLLSVHKGNVFFGFFYSLLSCRLDEQPKKSPAA